MWNFYLAAFAVPVTMFVGFTVQHVVAYRKTRKLEKTLRFNRFTGRYM